jgi:inorganic pyrophosphatase
VESVLQVDELRVISVTEYLDDIYFRWKVEVKDSNGYRAAWFDNWEDVIEQMESELKPVEKKED